jgi:hypothetical protein
MRPVTLLRTAPTLALFTGLAVLSGTARGTAPQRFHNHFVDSFSTNLCGIAVDVNIIVTDNFFLYSDGSSRDTYSVMQTFTNPANGKSVTVSGAGQIVGSQAIVDQAANTVTFAVTYKGLPEKIQTVNGPIIVRDAGLITFTNTFDLTTGDFISQSITVSKGPHPEADAEGALFCQVITEALT